MNKLLPILLVVFLLSININEANARTCESEKQRGYNDVWSGTSLNSAKTYKGCYRQGIDKARDERMKIYQSCLNSKQYDDGYEDAYEGERPKYKISPRKCYSWGYFDGDLDSYCEHHRLRDNYDYWISEKCNTRPYEPKSWSDR